MEIIIQIPDGEYEDLIGLYKLGLDQPAYKTFIEKTCIEAIANGTPYNPSGDLISRSELKKILKENEWITDDPFADGGVLEEIIDNVPSIETYPFEQVQELVKLNQQFAQEIENLKRPQGKWVGNALDEHHCSRCGHPALWEEEPDNYYEVQSRFCPNCGADMRDDKKETTWVVQNKKSD